jgi:hypothetical protein
MQPQHIHGFSHKNTITEVATVGIRYVLRNNFVAVELGWGLQVATGTEINH